MFISSCPDDSGLSIGSALYLYNHILDFNKEGMLETFKNLDELNIEHVGSGINKIKAKEPILRKYKGIKILIFGGSDHYDYWAAGKPNNIKKKSNKS